jgi:hypothetical protein
MASEFARDKEGTLKDLRKCIEESHHRHGLGSLRFEELDKVGPSYATQAPHSETKVEEDAATTTKTK